MEKYDPEEDEGTNEKGHCTIISSLFTGIACIGPETLEWLMRF